MTDPIRQRAARLSIHPMRSRAWLLASLVAVIALGLASRAFPSLFPGVLGKYPGDALWSLMVFVGLALVTPRASGVRLAALAFAISCAVEFSQLYQAPWLNAIRRTTLGHLALGSTFSWPDIAAYAAGILLGALIDASISFASSARRRAAAAPHTQPQPRAEDRHS